MYFDVKKELDVARIEQLINEVSPTSAIEERKDLTANRTNEQD